jgi:TfoX/Sxy family transcriptional regulator of competence genes
MQIPRPTEEDAQRFRSLVPDDPRVEVKPMFGNLGAFVNGNMFMGLYGADIGLKLAPADADELRGIEGAGPFGPEERPMGGYVTLPGSLAAEPAAGGWVTRALEHVAELPPKPDQKTKASKGAKR